MFTGSTLNAIGTLAGALNVVHFGKDHMASHEKDKATVKVGVGIDYFEGPNVYKMPDIRLWNKKGDYWGMAANIQPLEGPVGQVRIGPSDKAGDIEYALFSSNVDAICVSFISIDLPSGEEKYAWTGDWGKQCGGSWYYSNIELKDNKYKPPCVWIDGSPYKPHTGFSLHFPSFAAPYDKITKQMNDTDFCNTKGIFTLHGEERPNAIDFVGGISGEPAPQDMPGNKRQNQNLRQHPVHWAFPQGPNGRLVVTKDPKHSTQDLCDSSTSSGPDLANIHERKMCRMTDKTMWPICSHPEEYNCFDVAAKQLIPGAPAEETVRTYGYSYVHDWAGLDEH